jgi:hypothetical protein
MLPSQNQLHQVKSEADGTQPRQDASTLSESNKTYRRTPFSRQPSLGQYNATREEWRQVYREARQRARRAQEPDASTSGITWKAQLIVTFERGLHLDQLQSPIGERLTAKKLIDGIVGLKVPDAGAR